MIRIDTDSYDNFGQKYGLPSQKCGMSVTEHIYKKMFFLSKIVFTFPRPMRGEVLSLPTELSGDQVSTRI